MTPLPAEAVARFTAAEARLYPLAMVDADLYQRGTTWVGTALAALRERAGDIPGVLALRESLITELAPPAGTDDGGLSLAGVSVATAVDCASGLRCRELQEADRHADVATRVAAAAEAGQEWLPMQVADPAAAMAGSYREVTLHVPTGAAVVTTVEMEPGGGAAYGVEVVGREPGAAAHRPEQRFTDRDSWLAAIQDARSDLSRGS